MSYTKNSSIVCDSCHLFCNPVDQETPFGCADPEQPEPFEPSHYCAKCQPKNLEQWREHFKAGGRSGYWEKSNAENLAAKEAGLVWIGSSGVGTYGTETDSGNYRYITEERYNQIKDLPRFVQRKEPDAN